MSNTMFTCTADDCTAPTDGHYCLVHSVECDNCGAEWQVGHLATVEVARGLYEELCADCVRAAVCQ